MVVEITKTFVRSGGSYARGTTIDEHIKDIHREIKDKKMDANELLYELWPKQAGWPEWFVFQGNITAITSEMILEVPLETFEAAFRKGHTGKEARLVGEIAREIYTKAQATAGR